MLIGDVKFDTKDGPILKNSRQELQHPPSMTVFLVHLFSQAAIICRGCPHYLWKKQTIWWILFIPKSWNSSTFQEVLEAVVMV